jgi:hypothetical protein
LLVAIRFEPKNLLKLNRCLLPHPFVLSGIHTRFVLLRIGRSKMQVRRSESGIEQHSLIKVCDYIANSSPSCEAAISNTAACLHSKTY